MAIKNVKQVRTHLRGGAPTDPVDAVFIDPDTNQLTNCKITGILLDEVGNDVSGWTKTYTFVVKPA